MAVAFDSSVESHTGTTGSVSEASFTFDITPVGTARGVTVIVFNTNNNNNIVSSVTADGTNVPAITGAEATDNAVELGFVKGYHLGSSVPTGILTIVVNRTNNTDVLYAVAITETAGADTEATGVITLSDNGTLAEQSVDDGSPGTSSLRIAGAHFGNTAPPVTGANSTTAQSIDLGAYGEKVVYETTPGQGARLVGFTEGAANNRAAIHFAIREISSTAGSLIHGKLVNGLLNHGRLQG